MTLEMSDINAATARLRADGFEPRLLLVGPDAAESVRTHPKFNEHSDRGVDGAIAGIGVSTQYTIDSAMDVGFLIGEDEGGQVSVEVVGQ